jgi:hypothetical protein
MNCDKAKSLLGWFYDGELNAADRKLVTEHVDHCPDCAGELAALADLDRASRQLVTLEPAPDLWNRIARRLPPDQATQRTVGRRRFLLAAGALAASLAGVVLTYRLTWRRDSAVGKGDGSGVHVVAEPSGPADPIITNLALLDPEDRRLAESQEICAAGECVARLGAGGRPVKVVLQDKAIFLCCRECAQWARDHPAETVAKVHTLELRHESSKQRP